MSTFFEKIRNIALLYIFYLIILIIAIVLIVKTLAPHVGSVAGAVANVKTGGMVPK